MEKRADLRSLLFALSCAALLVAGLALRGEAGSKTVRVAQSGLVEPTAALARGPEAQALRRDAAWFLNAFFQYEEGGRSSKLFRRLQTSSTPKFAAQLLDAPPRIPSRLAPAQIQRIAIKEASWGSAIAVVSGAALRDERREAFSFLFAKEAGRWVAAGPAP